MLTTVINPIFPNGLNKTNSAQLIQPNGGRTVILIGSIIMCGLATLIPIAIPIIIAIGRALVRIASIPWIPLKIIIKVLGIIKFLALICKYARKIAIIAVKVRKLLNLPLRIVKIVINTVKKLSPAIKWTISKLKHIIAKFTGYLGGGGGNKGEGGEGNGCC